MYLEISVKKFISKCSECNINYMIWWVSKQGFIHWFKVQKNENRRVAVCDDRVIIAHYPLMIENIVKNYRRPARASMTSLRSRESRCDVKNHTFSQYLYKKVPWITFWYRKLSMFSKRQMHHLVLRRGKTKLLTIG